MKRILCLLFLSCLFLVACTENKPKQKVELNGSVISNSAVIRIFGTSNLQKGSVLQVVLKKVNENPSKSIMDEKVTVGEGGKFSWTAKKPNRNEEFELNVLFLPEKQTEKIKDVYGEAGEFIKKESPGIISYKHNDKKYSGIKKYDLVVNQQDTMLVESLPTY
jgi:hypothetical protein